MAAGAEPRAWFFFDDGEKDLVASALACVRGADPAEERLLLASLDRLHRLAEVLRDSPPIAASWPSARRGTNLGEALIDLLCRVPDYDLDLHVPTKAVLGQAYVVAKINLLKSFGYALAAIGGCEPLLEGVQVEIGQSIYAKMAEELFLSILTDPDGERGVKVMAGRFLLEIWENRLFTEVHDFAPLLETTWRARNRVRPILGTMIGAQEVAQLLREGSDERFLEHFSCDDVPDEQLAAFEEFLFGLSFEQIAALREAMGRASLRCVSAEQARGILGLTQEAWVLGPAAPSHVGEAPQAMYTSYKQRRVAAGHRGRTGSAGPKKTAEEYVVTAYLRRAAVTQRISRPPQPV